VSVCRTFQPCFLAVEITVRLTTKVKAASENPPFDGRSILSFGQKVTLKANYKKVLHPLQKCRKCRKCIQHCLSAFLAFLQGMKD
jgi:hypothetical protein